MTPVSGFLALSVLMALGGVALSWAGAIRRKRIEEERTLSTSYAKLRKGA